MSDKKIEVTIPETETTPEKIEDRSAEILANKAEDKAEEAAEESQEAEKSAAQAEQASKKAETAAEKAEKSTSYNEFALKGLMDSVSLVAQRMEQVMNIVKQMAEDFQEVNEELRATLELHQDQIGQLDETANKLVTATAALVKVHKEMNQATE